MANTHPWFGGVPIDQSAGWTWEYFQKNTIAAAEAASVRSHFLMHFQSQFHSDIFPFAEQSYSLHS